MNALITYYLPTERENYAELAKLTVPLRDEYCARHRVDHLVFAGPYHNPGWYYAFQRLKLVRDLMNGRAYRYFWVLNVQALITNMTVDFEDFASPGDWMLVTRDVNSLNAGSMIFANCDWTKRWLDYIISLEPVYRNDCWYEQRAMIHNYEKPEWAEHIKILPQNTINSYDHSLYNLSTEIDGHWRPGDLTLSLPGLNLQQRLEIARSEKWQKRIVR